MDIINIYERLNMASMGAKAVVHLNKYEDKLLLLDFTNANTGLATGIVEDITLFSSYISKQLTSAQARYGIGGYNEHRTV